MRSTAPHTSLSISLVLKDSCVFVLNSAMQSHHMSYFLILIKKVALRKILQASIATEFPRDPSMEANIVDVFYKIAKTGV